MRRATSSRTIGATFVAGRPRPDDDWIADRRPALAAEANRLWLVTSDRGPRERVAASVERAIGGGSFAGMLEQLQP